MELAGTSEKRRPGKIVRDPSSSMKNAKFLT